MTGCPNGCVRPYQSDIGIVGRSGDKYTLFVGGNLVGSRLNFVLKDLVPIGEIVRTLSPLLADFKQHRLGTESFGDYCHRLGADKLLASAGTAPGRIDNSAPRRPGSRHERTREFKRKSLTSVFGAVSIGR